MKEGRNLGRKGGNNFLFKSEKKLDQIKKETSEKKFCGVVFLVVFVVGFFCCFFGGGLFVCLAGGFCWFCLRYLFFFLSGDSLTTNVKLS